MNKIKEVTKNENGSAVAELVTGAKCIVSARAFEIGGNTVTPLTKENSNMIIRMALEYLDLSGGLTGVYELCNELNIKCHTQDVPSSDLFSIEVRDWIVSELCAEHIV